MLNNRLTVLIITLVFFASACSPYRYQRLPKSSGFSNEVDRGSTVRVTLISGEIISGIVHHVGGTYIVIKSSLGANTGYTTIEASEVITIDKRKTRIVLAVIYFFAAFLAGCILMIPNWGDPPDAIEVPVEPDAQDSPEGWKHSPEGWKR